MLQYNNWTIEQTQWLPENEVDIEQQLTFSNGYLCQTAHFEEYYSGEQRLCTYIQGVESPILNISGVSIRLHEERLDLATWNVEEFYRCLHKNTPMLERKFIAVSPSGIRLRVHVKRQLMPQEEVMQIDYEIVSENYSGPISLLAYLGGNLDTPNWYPLMNHIDKNQCWLWLQLPDVDMQLCCAMNWRIAVDGQTFDKRPIKIEKHHTIGYSVTTNIQPGNTCLFQKTVSVVDSRRYQKDQLIAAALKCLTNW